MIQCIKEVLVIALIISMSLHHRVSDSGCRWEQLIGKVVAHRTQVIIDSVAIHRAFLVELSVHGPRDIAQYLYVT